MKHLIKTKEELRNIITNIQNNEDMIENFNTYYDYSSITDMSFLFSTDTQHNDFIKKVPNLKTENVIDMSGMFWGCTNLVGIPFLNTSNVTNMDSMFGNCYSLREIPLLDTSNVESMNGMFYDCQDLLKVSKLNTSKVKDLSEVFSGCTYLVEVPVFNTSSVENMEEIVLDCISLNKESMINILLTINHEQEDKFKKKIYTNSSFESIENLLFS